MPPHAGASSQAIDLSQSISPLDNFDFSKFAYQNDLMHGGGAGGPGGGGGGAESYNWLSTVDSSQSDPSSIYSGSPSPPGEFTHPVQVHVHAPQPHHAAGGAPLGVWKDVGSGATTPPHNPHPPPSFWVRALGRRSDIARRRRRRASDELRPAAAAAASSSSRPR